MSADEEFAREVRLREEQFPRQDPETLKRLAVQRHYWKVGMSGRATQLSLGENTTPCTGCGYRFGWHSRGCPGPGIENT